MTSYYERNKEARLAYQKQYNKEHRESYNEYHKNYYYEYAYRYRENNREKINKQKLESYYRNIEKKQQENKKKEEMKKKIKKVEKIKNVVLHVPEPPSSPIFVGISVAQNGNFKLEW